MTNEITDEMVEKATEAASLHSMAHWQIRAALEAVAPRLRAQGVREAAIIANDYDPHCAMALNARAAELEK